MLYQLPPSTMIHSILLFQFVCLTVIAETVRWAECQNEIFRTAKQMVKERRGDAYNYNTELLQSAPAAIAVSVRLKPRSVSRGRSGRHGAAWCVWSLRCSAARTCGSQWRVNGDRRRMKLRLRRGQRRNAVRSCCRNVSATYRQHTITGLQW